MEPGHSSLISETSIVSKLQIQCLKEVVSEVIVIKILSASLTSGKRLSKSNMMKLHRLSTVVHN